MFVDGAILGSVSQELSGRRDPLLFLWRSASLGRPLGAPLQRSGKVGKQDETRLVVQYGECRLQVLPCLQVHLRCHIRLSQ